MRRLAVTLVIPLIALAIRQVSLPYIDADAVDRMLRAPDGDGLLARARGLADLSVISLGLTPAIRAFVIVEILAALIPAWRPLRHSGPEGRRKLTVAALLLTVALAAYSAYSVGEMASSFNIVTTWGLLPRGVMMATLMAGVFLQLGLAGLAQRFGLGNGILTLLAAHMLFDEISWFAAQARAPDDVSSLGPLSVVVMLLIAALYAAATLVILGVPWRTLLGALSGREMTESHGAPANNPYRAAPRTVRLGPLPCPTSGIGPFFAAATLLNLPNQLAALGLPVGGVTVAIYRSGLFMPLYLALLAGLGIAFSFLFNPPDQIAAVRARARQDDAAPDALGAEAKLDLNRATVRSAVYIVAIAGLAEVSWRLVNHRIDQIMVILLTAAALDIRADWLARRAVPDLVPVWQEHRPFAVDAALQALAREGISAHARALYGRLMLQLFGPFAPIEIMVRPEKAEAARGVVQRVLTGREASGGA